MSKRIHPADLGHLDTAPNRNIEIEKVSSQEVQEQQSKNLLLTTGVGTTNSNATGSNSIDDAFKLYQQFQRQRKSYNACFDRIFEIRLIEKLGGISPREEKLQVFNETMGIFREIANICERVQDTIKLISFEKDDLLVVTSKNGRFQEHISDSIIREVKEMDQRYRELIETSSFRYMDSVAEVNEIKPAEFSVIYMNTKDWSNQIIEGIVQTLPAASTKRMNSASTNMDRDKDNTQSKTQKGCLEQICPCFFSQKDITQSSKAAPTLQQQNTVDKAEKSQRIKIKNQDED